MSTGWNHQKVQSRCDLIINLLGNEYWLERIVAQQALMHDYKPTGK